MNSIILRYAFIDESGTVGIEKGTKYFVVALASVEQPRTLQLPVRRALKKYGRLSSGELKASNLKKTATERILSEIARQDATIVAVIVDQQAIIQPPDDNEKIYRHAAARAVYHLVEKFPSVHVALDSRYTKAQLRDELEKHIRQEIRDLQHHVVLIRHENSCHIKELQAVDAIAWAFFQKYERGNSRYYDIISTKIIAEELISARNWKQLES